MELSAGERKIFEDRSIGPVHFFRKWTEVSEPISFYKTRKTLLVELSITQLLGVISKYRGTQNSIILQSGLIGPCCSSLIFPSNPGYD